MSELRKGTTMIVKITDSIYPNIGIACVNEQQIRIKNVLPEQKVKIKITRKRTGYYQGKLLEIIEPSPLEIEARCIHYRQCGGCTMQSLDYHQQLKLKEKHIKKLFSDADLNNYIFLGIIPSPSLFSYRNKMEFSFGDLRKEGQLQLGMHPRGKRFAVISVENCQLVDEDFNLILKTVLDYCRKENLPKYHIQKRNGFLRHLVVRKGLKTGEILINLITTSQLKHDFQELKNILKNLNYDGELAGFLQTINDGLADTVKCDHLLIHFGRDYYYEEILGLKFKIKPFSFFQPNTFGAEKLYSTVLKFIKNAYNKTIFDLYCGTGTISQIAAVQAKEVVGIELIDEAVEMAKENAQNNGLKNCKFISGDVLEKLNDLKQNPDLIIIDPPRPGVHPKALEKIINFSAKEIIYVSCNPKTLVKDLKIMTENGYKLKEVKCIDMFPHTNHIETVVRLCCQDKD